MDVLVNSAGAGPENERAAEVSIVRTPLQTVGLERRVAEAKAQRRSGQGGLGKRIARRSDDAAELGRRALGRGQPGVSGLAVKPARAARSRQIDMTRPANNISI